MRSGWLGCRGFEIGAVASSAEAGDDCVSERTFNMSTALANLLLYARRDISSTPLYYSGSQESLKEEEELRWRSRFGRKQELMRCLY